MKKITSSCVVALEWTMKDTLGTILDVLDEPVEFLIGGNDLLDAIQTQLQNHSEGDVVNLHLEPTDAFGDFDENLLFLEPKNLFPNELEEGMTFDGQSLPKGCSSTIPMDVFYTVAEIYPDHVVLDGNHPLAGMAIRLNMKVGLVREATATEVEAGTCGVGFFTPHP